VTALLDDEQGRKAQRRLRDAVDEAAREELLDPVHALRADHDRFCAAVTLTKS